MIPCVSVQNMRQSDADTIERFVPSLELMYRAANGVYLSADWNGKIAILVGSGNNGGDGYALACILKKQAYDCTVFTVSSRCSEDGAYYAQRAAETGVPIQPYVSGCLDGFCMLVDCLLGTGFTGTVRGVYRAAIEEINRSDAYTVSVDINSGMNGDTGEAELAVQSDLTVTIGYVKTGLVSPSAGTYIKRLVCADIGIVLSREEKQIFSAEEKAVSHGIPCPSWLDMRTVKAF